MGSGGHNKISREVLIEDIEAVVEQTDGTPRLADYRELGTHSAKAIYNEFENWNIALSELNLSPNQIKNKERIEFTCDGPDCSQLVEKLRSDAKQSEHHYCSQDCLNEHKSVRFRNDGNPQSTLECVECGACGSEIMRPKWKREKNERHYCSNCWGESNVSIECEWCDSNFSVVPALSEKARFCSRSCKNSWQSENVTGEDHPRWRGGYEPYYGPNWKRQRRNAIIRDQARCQDCGISEAHHWEKHGERLSVHHLTPIREFITGDILDHEEANEIENLVTLCRSCHSQQETASP